MPAFVPFAVRASRPDDGSLVLRVVGDLDIATTPAFRDCWERELPVADTTLVVVDLSETRFVDSTAVAALLDLRGAAPDLVVRAPSPPVVRVLELLGLAAHLQVEGP